MADPTRQRWVSRCIDTRSTHDLAEVFKRGALRRMAEGAIDHTVRLWVFGVTAGWGMSMM